MWISEHNGWIKWMNLGWIFIQYFSIQGMEHMYTYKFSYLMEKFHLQRDEYRRYFNPDEGVFHLQRMKYRGCFNPRWVWFQPSNYESSSVFQHLWEIFCSKCEQSVFFSLRWIHLMHFASHKWLQHLNTSHDECWTSRHSNINHHLRQRCLPPSPSPSPHHHHHYVHTRTATPHSLRHHHHLQTSRLDERGPNDGNCHLPQISFLFLFFSIN